MISMVAWNRNLLLASLFFATALAGCTEEATTEEAAAPNQSVDPYTGTDGRDLRLELQAADVLVGPEWNLGQLFRYHIFFGVADDQGYHWNASVVEDKATTWTVAPDDAMTAQYESMFDFAVLGEFTKDDLATSSYGKSWAWYDFPLTDGKSWTRELELADDFGAISGTFNTYTLNFTSTYNPAITIQEGQYPATMAVGRPGFDITVRAEDGTLYAKYDYVPAVGWFAHYWEYDPRSGEANPGDDAWRVHVTTMGTEANWTGTYYIDEAEKRLELLEYYYPDPEDPQRGLHPQPSSEFEVGEGSTYLHAFVFSFTETGTTQTALVDPNNQHYNYEANDVGIDVEQGADNGQEWILDPIPGTWRLVTAHAAVGAGTFALVFEITEHAFEHTGS